MFRRLRVIELTKEPTKTIDEVRMFAKQRRKRGLEERLNVPRTVGYEVVVPLTSGAGRQVSNWFSSWKGCTHHRVLDAQGLTLRVSQAVPSGHYLAVPHAGYFPISPRTLRLAASHLLAKQEPYSSKKTYVPPKDPIVKIWNWKRSRSSLERLMAW